MGFNILKYAMKSWHVSYCFHRRSHKCGICESASWAWWNIWNPITSGGGKSWSNCYLSAKAGKQIEKREKEWRDIFSHVILRERKLEKKWKEFNDLTVNDYISRAKHSNKSTIENLKRRMKKLEKSKKRRKQLDI
jgi:hypothetical protein